MAIIDGTAVNLALPAIQRDLGATVGEVLWIVESYALFLAALLLVGGSLGDHFGRRRIFTSGIALFALASVWCGLASDATELIVARAAQGIGGALLVPGSLAILSSTFSEEQRGRAIGTWSSFTAMAAALGPVLGGWLVEHASWRWVFFINVPLAVVVLAISFHCVPESRDPDAPGSLDWWGALLATAGLGAIVYGLIHSTTVGATHPVVVIAVAAGILMMVGFFTVEARSPAPMIPLDLFRSRTFRGANLLTLLLYAALSGSLFFFPFNLIQVQGYSATTAGAALLPLILMLFTLSRWAGGLVNRYGARRPLTLGPLLAAVGFALFAWPGIGGSYWTTYFPAVGLLGVGMAVSVAPLTTTVMSAVETRRAGIASGINNTASRTAGLLAVAVLGLVVLHVFNANLDRRLLTLDIPTTAHRALNAQRINLAGAAVPGGLPPELTAAIERSIAESFVNAFRVAMLIASGLALAAALSAWLLIESKGPTRTPPSP